MISPFITASILILSILTIALFIMGEVFDSKRKLICGIAAVFEGIVFINISYVFFLIEWSGLSNDYIMAGLPLIGAVLSWRMAYRRFSGLEA